MVMQIFPNDGIMTKQPETNTMLYFTLRIMAALREWLGSVGSPKHSAQAVINTLFLNIRTAVLHRLF